MLTSTEKQANKKSKSTKSLHESTSRKPRIPSRNLMADFKVADAKSAAKVVFKTSIGAQDGSLGLMSSERKSSFNRHKFQPKDQYTGQDHPPKQLAKRIVPNFNNENVNTMNNIKAFSLPQSYIIALEILQSTVEDQRKQIVSVEAQIEQLQSKIAKQDKQNMNLKKEIQGLEQRNRQKVMEIKTLDQYNNKLREEINTLNIVVNELKKKQQNSFDSYEKGLKEHKNIAIRLENQKQELNAVIKNKDMQLNKLTKDVILLEQSNQVLRQELENFRFDRVNDTLAKSTNGRNIDQTKNNDGRLSRIRALTADKQSNHKGYQNKLNHGKFYQCAAKQQFPYEVSENCGLSASYTPQLYMKGNKEVVSHLRGLMRHQKELVGLNYRLECLQQRIVDKKASSLMKQEYHQLKQQIQSKQALVRELQYTH